jgi:gliding motility-associated-like protein
MKKKHLSILILLLYQSLVLAQNLVPNPSFEQTNSCDFNYFISMDTSANLLPSQYPDVLYWLRANQSPIRYGNRCYNALHPGQAGGGVPTSEVGYQEPRTGDAYFKAWIYDKTPVYPNGEHRAYLQVQLLDTLKRGHLYCGDMYVNQSYSSGEDYNIVTTDAMAMALTKHRPFNNSLALYQDDTAKTAIYVEPAIINRGFFPNDTLGWQRIHGIYKAKGGEKWLTLGNFYNRDTTITQIIRPFTAIEVKDTYTAPFYIDDVSLHEISAPLFSRRDTVVCSFPMQVTTRSGFDTYLWSTGATTQTATLPQAGVYWVKVSSECGSAVDTIVVRSMAMAQASTHRDTTACLPIVLTAKNTAGGYTWNTGDVAATLVVASPGTYWVKRQIAACSVQTDTVHVYETQPPTPLHFPDTLLCATDFPIRYTVPPVFSNIQWSDNTTDNPKDIIKKGVYSLAANWECGTLRDTFVVQSENPLPPLQLLTQDTTSCMHGQFVPFRLRAPFGYPNYLWNTGATTRSILIQKEGIYALSTSNICGTQTDAIKVEGCPPNYYIPNTFTPNNDGHNDVFTVFTTDAIVNVKMQIFDRWGECVSPPQSPQRGEDSRAIAWLCWDGNFRGQFAASDVYVYSAVLVFADGTTKTVTGDVTLLR